MAHREREKSNDTSPAYQESPCLRQNCYSHFVSFLSPLPLTLILIPSYSHPLWNRLGAVAHRHRKCTGDICCKLALRPTELEPDLIYTGLNLEWLHCSLWSCAILVASESAKVQRLKVHFSPPPHSMPYISNLGLDPGSRTTWVQGSVNLILIMGAGHLIPLHLFENPVLVK